MNSNKFLCRTCLDRNVNTTPISDVVKIANNNVNFTDILALFYNYKVDPKDGMPQEICVNCVYQLTVTFSFNILIRTSEKKLQENIYNKGSREDLNCDDSFDSDSDEKIKADSSLPIKNTSQILFCTKCKQNFNNSTSLYQHCIEKHPMENSFGRNCCYCNEKFEEFSSLIIHRKKHLSPYVCEACWESYQSLDDIKSHFCDKIDNDNNKNINEKQYKPCEVCGRFYQKSYFKIHMLIHSEKRLYSCSYCPKKFKVPCSLNSHVLWIHKRTRQHQCNICNQTFVSASAKSTHHRKCHLKERKHSCKACGKSFFSKSEIQRHMLTHTGVKNFHCRLCTKSYQTRYGLNVHMRGHAMQALREANKCST